MRATPLPPTLLRHPALRAHAVTLTPDDGGAASETALTLPPSLAHAAPRRVATFLAGRHCARQALRACGAGETAVGRADDGAPVWPAGFVGSITHTDDRALAAAARRADVAALGIDCERLLSADAAAEIRPQLLAPDEAAHLRGADALPTPVLLTVLFSAKESVYKCLRPTVGAFFDFHDVHATAVAPRGDGTGGVALRVARDLGGVRDGTLLRAEFAVADDHVHTAVMLPSG